MKYPLVRINIEVPYEDYKELVQLKGDKTWREVLYEWAKMQGAKMQQEVKG